MKIIIEMSDRDYDKLAKEAKFFFDEYESTGVHYYEQIRRENRQNDKHAYVNMYIRKILDTLLR